MTGRGPGRKAKHDSSRLTRHIVPSPQAFIDETHCLEDAMANPNFTPPQALAHERLTRAIGNALGAGERVPCVEDPTAWDELTSAWFCLRCPVLTTCSAYADTGAVEHGILAGRRMTPNQRRARTRERAA